MSSQLDKVYELATLRDPKTGKWLLGRRGIAEQCPEVTEWKIRTIIREVRGEGKPSGAAPTPEERSRNEREAEQVNLPKLVYNIPALPHVSKPKGSVRYWVFGSDFHAPYQDEPSCSIFMQIVQDLNPERVTLLGDVLTLDQFSRYPGDGKYPGAPTWLDEIAVAGKIMANVRQAAPNAILQWFEGNHELRLKKHLMRNDPVLYSHLDISKLFFLAENTHASKEFNFFDYVDQPEIFDEELGIIIKHGTKVRKHSGMSAMAEVDDLLFSVVMGHCHRLGLYRRSSGRSRYMQDQPLFGMETGCLCRYDLPYVEGSTSNWQHGFGVLAIDDSVKGKPVVEPMVVEINNQRALFRGKVYTA